MRDEVDQTETGGIIEDNGEITERVRWIGRDTAEPAEDDARCQYCGDTTRDLYYVGADLCGDCLKPDLFSYFHTVD